MAGKGPASTGRAIRRNAAPGFTQVEAKPVPQPKLPDVWITKAVYNENLDEWVEKRVKMTWNPNTVRWWKGWGESPLMQDATAEDWSFLTDTALLHHAYWSGEVKVAAELRLRVAKFGATPEDRMRLKVQFAPPAASGEENTEEQTGGRSRARRGGFTLVQGEAAG